MPIPIYAKFDGIEGSCTVKGREGTVEVLAFDHIVEIPVDVKDATATGTRRHGAVTLIANIDKATPLLLESVCTSKAIPKVVIDFYNVSKDGKQTKYYTITLENCRVTKAQTWFPNVDDASTKTYKHMMTYELRYEKITWTYLDGNIEFMDAWLEPK